MAAALAAVLSLIKVKLPHLLYGGSVSLHLVPIFVVSLRRGLRPGLAVGTSYGLLNFLITPYFVHPLQVLLDYPVAFAAVGLAGLARSIGTGSVALAAIGGVLTGSAGRLAAHFASGVVYFSHLAPEGTAVWAYSLAYNSSYVVPEALICAFIVPVVLSRLPRIDPGDTRRPT